MKTWADTTLWSRDDTDRNNPREWALKIDYGFEIVIHRRFGYADQIWFLTCYKLNITAHQMGAMSADEAKKKAIEMVRAHAIKIVNALKDLE